MLCKCIWYDTIADNTTILLTKNTNNFFNKLEWSKYFFKQQVDGTNLHLIFRSKTMIYKGQGHMHRFFSNTNITRNIVTKHEHSSVYKN